MCEDGDAATSMLLNDFVQFSGCAIQRLTVTFPTFQYVFEVAVKKGLILFRVLLCSFFKRKTFHYADAAFTKSVRRYEGSARELCERAGCLNRPR